MARPGGFEPPSCSFGDCCVSITPRPQRVLPDSHRREQGCNLPPNCSAKDSWCRLEVSHPRCCNSICFTDRFQDFLVDGMVPTRGVEPRHPGLQPVCIPNAGRHVGDERRYRPLDTSSPRGAASRDAVCATPIGHQTLAAWERGGPELWSREESNPQLVGASDGSSH